jgi:hypothetical protein
MTTPVLFLDDASRHAGSVDRNRAEQTALTLLGTLRSLRKVNKKIALNTARPIAHHAVAENWTLQIVLGGTRFKEEWDFIRALSDRSPFAAGLEDGLLAEIGDMEFRTRPGKVPSTALAWATLVDSATVSFDGHTDWSQAWVETSYNVLQEDGSVSESEGKVRNASQADHAGAHQDWLKVLGLTSAPTAAEVWKDREERYPSLRFLPRVEKDLGVLEGSGVALQYAVSAIESLAKDAADWKADVAWPVFSTLASPEGEVRKKLCSVHDEATGKKELFDWHTRFTGGWAGRIHFRVDGPTRTIVVAYVGAKLARAIEG